MEADSEGKERVSKLALDVKALTLLYGSDAKLQGLLEHEFIDSRDENIKRFVRLLKVDRESPAHGAFAVAIGEIILASFLTILGIAAFMPNLVGLDNPRSLFDYFAPLVPSSVESGPLFSAAVALEFVFAALLMLGAFYSLRRAAVSLKQTGILPDT